MRQDAWIARHRNETAESSASDAPSADEARRILTANDTPLSDEADFSVEEALAAYRRFQEAPLSDELDLKDLPRSAVLA